MDSKVVLQLIIVRHGQSYGNTGEIPQDAIPFDKNDPPLTPTGLLQVKLLGDRLAKGRIDAMYSSPLTRAVQTAQAVAEARNDDLKFRCLADIMEVDTLPGYRGCDAERMKNDFPDAVPEKDGPLIPGGALYLDSEDRDARNRRAKRVVDYMRTKYADGETVVLVTHGTFISYLIRNCLGLGDEEVCRFSADNSGVTKIKFYDNGTPKLSYSNDTSHLYAVEPDKAFTI